MESANIPTDDEIEELRRKIALYPTELRLRFELGAALFKRQDYSTAIPELMKAQNQEMTIAQDQRRFRYLRVPLLHLIHRVLKGVPMKMTAPPKVAGANRRWRLQFRCRGSRRESAVAQLR